MNFYQFYIKYWNEYMPEDIDSEECNGIVVADSYTEAMEKVVHRFDNVIECTLREALSDNGFLFDDDEDDMEVLERLMNYEC